MNVRILVAIVVLALIAGVVYRTEFAERGDADRGGGDRAIAVKTVAVELRDFPRAIDLPGTLEAAQQVAIVAQTSGTVLQQHVQEGDRVRAGEPLFTLDARPAQARIAQSQAALTGARAETDEAEKTVERLAPLMRSGYISQQEYDLARVALESARARAGTARAELESARIDARYAQIRSPLAGRVGRIAIRPGSLVQAGGESLTTVVAPGALDVRAALSEADWPQVIAARAAGRVMAEVRPDSLGAAAGQAVVLPGELVFVDSQLDSATGAVPLKVRIVGSPGVLMPGQSVRLRLLLGSLAAVRVLPEAALQQGQDGTYVYVVRDDRAVIQPVRATHDLDGLRVVEGALRAGEAVLIEVPKRLRAGGQVRLEDLAAARQAGEVGP